MNKKTLIFLTASFVLKSLFAAEIETDYFKYYSKVHLDAAYEDAPQEVKDILIDLQTPDIDIADPDIPAAFFYGPPGTRKTTTAVMMAYKLGWGFNMTRGTKFTGGERGTATVNLREHLKALTSPNLDGETIPVVAIIDEVEEILANANDTHYATDSTSLELGGFLEDRRNKNFLFIATMNAYTTFSEAMKSRMKCKVITFEKIVNPQQKVKAFQQNSVPIKYGFMANVHLSFY
jgi:SpoVK/Ycf46/Vps4 family AAA+-type ATPase